MHAPRRLRSLSLAVVVGTVVLTGCSSTQQAQDRKASDMSIAPLTVTNTLVVDGSLVPITLTVTDVDNFDWGGPARPDSTELGFQGVVLDAAQPSLRRDLEVNSNASTVRFTMIGSVTSRGKATEIFRARLSDWNSWVFAQDETANHRGDCDIWHVFPGELNSPVKVRAACANHGNVLEVAPVTAGEQPVTGTSITQPLSIDNRVVVKGQPVAITLHVSEVDNHDWDGASRPDSADHGFQGVTVSGDGTVLTRNLETNYYADPVRFVLSGTMAHLGAKPIELFRLPIISTVNGDGARHPESAPWIHQDDNSTGACGVWHTLQTARPEIGLTDLDVAITCPNSEFSPAPGHSQTLLIRNVGDR